MTPFGFETAPYGLTQATDLSSVSAEVLIREASCTPRVYPPDSVFSEDSALELVMSEHRFHPMFRDATFKQPVVWEDRHFPLGISFVNCTFEKAASFRRSVFYGPAYFWNCRFLDAFDFFHVVVKADHLPIQLREAGELNFSYCSFGQKPDVTSPLRKLHAIQPNLHRTVCEGPAFFHRTIFHQGVSAEECRFEAGAKFDDVESDICLHRSEVPTVITDALPTESPRVLFPNTDHGDHFDFDWNIRAESSLDRALIRTLDEGNRKLRGLPRSTSPSNTGLYRLRQTALRSYRRLRRTAEDKPEAHTLGRVDFEPLRTFWRQRKAIKMFGGSEAAKDTATLSSFRSTTFGPTTLFSYVDLSNCRFQGANLEDIDFRVVRWVRQPCGLFWRKVVGFFIDIPQKWPQFPLLSWRYALRDELELDNKLSQFGDAGGQFRSRRIELSELYRELRMSYEREGDGQGARDFYFGELEAQRLSSNSFSRYLGLLNFYKCFSGYSKREGLAATWLIVFIIALFPYLFFSWINSAERDRLTVPPTAHASSFRSLAPIEERPVLNVLSLSLPKGKIISINVPSPHGPRPHALLSLGSSCRLSPTPLAAPSPGPDAKGGTPSKSDSERFDNAMERTLDAVDGGGSASSQYLRVLASSMQASTFITTSVQAGSVEALIQLLQSVRCESPDSQAFYRDDAAFLSGRENRRHFLEGIERLAIPAQLALLLLALRSKFQRSM